MHRRPFLFAAAAAAALCGCSAVQPSYTISAGQMEQALARRFPRSYPVAGDLLELQLQTPRLTLLPERNQINAVLELQASGMLLGQRHYGGALDVDFGLRYEPSDHTLRARDVHVNALRLDGLPPALEGQLTRYGQPLAEKSLREVVLHRWQPKDLTAADRLGLEPGSITVTPQGLVVQLAPKP